MPLNYTDYSAVDQYLTVLFHTGVYSEVWNAVQWVYL